MRSSQFILLILTVLVLSPTLAAAENKAYMGLYLEDVSTAHYQKIGMKGNYGILISKVVPDSPADSSGLQANDILMEIEGDKIYTRDQLTKMLTNFEPGQKVKLKYFRDGKEKTVKFAFGKKEEPQIKKKAYLGVYLKELSDKDKQKLNYDKNYGIMITDLVADGAAEKAGISKNSILMEIDGDKIYTVDQLTKMLTNYEPENVIKVKVFQDQKESTLDLILGEKAKFSFKNWSWDDYNLSYDKPGNIFVYRYPQDNDKWIGVKLHIVEDRKDDASKVTVTIEEVIADTPAEKAGLQAGDLILKVDGEKIDARKTVSKLINKREIGDTIEIQVERQGKTITLPCEVARRKDNERFERIELSLDDGKISVWMDGEERRLIDRDIISDKLKSVEVFTQEKIEKAVQKTKEEMKKLKNMEELEHLKQLEIQFGQNGAI